MITYGFPHGGSAIILGGVGPQAVAGSSAFFSYTCEGTVPRLSQRVDTFFVNVVPYVTPTCFTV